MDPEGRNMWRLLFSSIRALNSDLRFASNSQPSSRETKVVKKLAYTLSRQDHTATPNFVIWDLQSRTLAVLRYLRGQ